MLCYCIHFRFIQVSPNWGVTALHGVRTTKICRTVINVSMVERTLRQALREMRALAGSTLPAQCRHTPTRTRASVQHLPAAATRVRRAPLQAARRGAPLCRIASSPGPSSDSLDEQPTGVVGLERRINEAVVSSTVRASCRTESEHFLVLTHRPLSTGPHPPRSSCSTRCTQRGRTPGSTCWRPSRGCPTSVRAFASSSPP